jgi:hypothetical protein
VAKVNKKSDFFRISELTDKVVEEIQQTIHAQREQTSLKLHTLQELISPELEVRQRKLRKFK